MAGDGIKLTGDWKLLLQLTDPTKFHHRLNIGVKRAMTKACLYARKKVKLDIKAKKYDKNAPMTEAIKGSTTPLVDNNELVRSVTHKLFKGGYEAFVGVLKGTKRGDKDAVDLASVLHDGAIIPVTPKMRRYFFMMFMEGNDGWYPIADDTTEIVIPPRKFLEAPLSESDVQRRIIWYWMGAIEYAMTGKSDKLTGTL